MLIITSLLLTSLMGMLALVVDLGYAYGQRRLAQNFADSAALAATAVITQNVVAGNRTDADVANGIADVKNNSTGGFANYTAVYLDQNGVALGAAIGGGALPTAARGVRIQPTKSLPSFFGNVLNVHSLSVNAVAGATSQAVTGVLDDTVAGSDYAPYAVWGGNPGFLCPSSGGQPQYGCNMAGHTVTYRANDYTAQTGADISGNWDGNSNNFKGFLHDVGGLVSIGDWLSKGGNAIGQEPLAMMHDHWAAHRPVIMPLVDHEQGNGQIQLHVIGFVGVQLVEDPSATTPSTPWTGVIVPVTITSGGTTGGTPPPAGAPSVRYASLVQ